MKRLDYDKLFHLFILVRLSNNLVIRVEKNETISFKFVNENEVSYQDYIDIPIDFPNIQIRFGNFIQNTINMVGPDIYFYNHVNSNCQYFVLDLLKANGLLTSNLRMFIMQDIPSLLKKYGYVNNLTNALTTGASKFNRLLYGEGYFNYSSI